MVVIDWNDPITNGSPITAYRIYIQETNSGDFFQENFECDGTDDDVISARTCQVSL